MDEGDEVRRLIDRCRRDHLAWVNGDASGDDMSPAGGVALGGRSTVRLQRYCDRVSPLVGELQAADSVAGRQAPARSDGAWADGVVALPRLSRSVSSASRRVGMAASNWAGNYEYRV